MNNPLDATARMGISRWGNTLEIDMTQTPDRIWATGNEAMGSWNSTQVNPNTAPEQTVFLRATPAREAADDLLVAAKMTDAVMSEVAARVGPQHAWWDIIFDIRAAIAKARGQS
jgi:hypothetical protein